MKPPATPGGFQELPPPTEVMLATWHSVWNKVGTFPFRTPHPPNVPTETMEATGSLDYLRRRREVRAQEALALLLLKTNPMGAEKWRRLVL